jgi:hypothetical protein
MRELNQSNTSRIPTTMRTVLPHPLNLSVFVTLKHVPLPVYAQMGPHWIIVGWVERENVPMRK